MMTTLIVILALLILSASFSGLETALFSLTAVDRRRLRQGGGVSGLITKTLVSPRGLLTTVLLGNELVNVAISILAGGLALKLLKGVDIRIVFLLAISVTTLVLLIFGEIVPKNIAVRTPLSVAQVLIAPFRLFSWVVLPFRVGLGKIVDLLVNLAGADPKKGRRMIVEEEFRSLLEVSRQEGGTASLEEGLLQGALDFSRLTVSQIMTRRQQIVAIPTTLALGGVFKKIEENRFSRIPVFEGNLNQIVGILYAKDLLPVKGAESGGSVRTLQQMLKPPATVNPSDSLDVVFQKFRTSQIHMGIVRDEKGSVVGLVTMDDLLRRLFP